MPAKPTVFRKISDEAVKKKTRKTWKQWFSILDEFDVEEQGHEHAARHLLERYNIGLWWSQAVVIHYEWEKGLRTIKNQVKVRPSTSCFARKSDIAMNSVAQR